jgi:hypothetical protein
VLVDIIPDSLHRYLLTEGGKMAQVFSGGYALLIGVGGDLPVTVKDVNDLYQVLAHPERAGYPPGQVRLVIDGGQYTPTRQGILDGLNWLIGQVKNEPDATAVVYYSGHGLEIKDQNGDVKGYSLVPLGYKPQNRLQTAVSGKEFAEKIGALQVKKLLVLLDCCHAGGIPGTKDEVAAPSPLPRDLDALSLGGGQVVIASSRADEKSGYDAKNSYFTTALLEAMDGKGGATPQGQVPILSMLAYIYDRVPKLTGDNQHPFLYSARSMDQNFPVCYAQGGGFKGEADVFASLEAAGLTLAKPMPLSATERMILTAERDAALAELEIRLEKRKALGTARAIEAGTAVKFQLDRQYLQEEQEIDHLKEEIKTIEERLNA